jgi:hypothetical protein
VSFAAAGGVTPDTLLAASPFVGWRARASGARLEPAVRVALVRAGTAGRTVPGGAAAFTWTVGRLDGCATAWPHEVVRVAACARVEAGILEADGADAPSPQQRTRPWLAAGPLLRAEWTFAATLFLEAELGATLRVLDDRFFFIPDATAYKVPLLGAGGGAGLGARFL